MATTKSETATDTTKKTPKADPRLSGFYARRAKLLCLIGYDTEHDHRVSLGEGDDKAHPLYDVRVFDEPTAEDIDAAVSVGEDHDTVPVVRQKFPVRMFKKHYLKVLKAEGFDVSDPEALIEVECVVDGRHRTSAYREADKLNERSSLPPVLVKVELKKSLTEARQLALRIARNALRRDDSTKQKAEMMRDFCDIRLAEELEKGAEGSEKLTRKDFYVEAASYFGVTIVAVRQWAELLTRHPVLLEAVESGDLSASSAVESFRKVKYDEQPAALERVLKKGAKHHDDVKAAVTGADADDFGGASDDGDTEEEEEEEEEEEGGDDKPKKTKKPAGPPAEAASVATLGDFKADKATLRKIVDEYRAGRLKGGVSEEFIKGIEFCLARSVRTHGLTEALRGLKLVA